MPKWQLKASSPLLRVDSQDGISSALRAPSPVKREKDYQVFLFSLQAGLPY